MTELATLTTPGGMIGDHVGGLEIGRVFADGVYDWRPQASNAISLFATNESTTTGLGVNVWHNLPDVQPRKYGTITATFVAADGSTAVAQWHNGIRAGATFFMHAVSSTSGAAAEAGIHGASIVVANTRFTLGYDDGGTPTTIRLLIVGLANSPFLVGASSVFIEQRYLQ